MEKYGEFAPPASYLRMLKPKYGKSKKSKSKTKKSKKKKKWKAPKFKIEFSDDSSGSSSSYWACDSSDSSCSSDGDRYVHHYKSREYRGTSAAGPPLVMCICICCYLCGCVALAAIVGSKGGKYS